MTNWVDSLLDSLNNSPAMKVRPTKVNDTMIMNWGNKRVLIRYKFYDIDIEADESVKEELLYTPYTQLIEDILKHDLFMSKLNDIVRAYQL